MTSAGHDLLDVLREQNFWHKVKKEARELGIALTFEAVKIVASAITHRLMGSK
jgi:hypothetical protein